MMVEILGSFVVGITYGCILSFVTGLIYFGYKRTKIKKAYREQQKG